MSTDKNSKPDNDNRFMNLTAAAKKLGVNVSLISRYVLNGKLPGGNHQIYIKKNGRFYKVKGKKIKVVDMDTIDEDLMKDLRYTHI